MKLRFTPRAIEDISAISDYLLARNPSAATQVRAAIYDAAQNLLLFPRAGRRQTIEGVRKVVTKRYSYIIYYLFDEAADEVVVLNVKHSAQQREYADR